MAELTGPAILAPHPTSIVVNTSPAPIPLGTRMRDTKGNEHCYVTYSATVLAGMLVSINHIHESAALVNTAAPCLVGIAMAGATVGQRGWVMVWGIHTHVLGLSSAGDGQGSDEGVSVLSNGVLTVQSTAGNAGYVFLSDESIATNAALQIQNIWPIPQTLTSDFTSHNWNTSEASNASGPSTACSETTDSDVIYAMRLAYPYYTGLDGGAVAS